MSLTSNFDFAIELGIAQVKEIFHLAFKNEEIYPHNVGPVTRNLSGREVTVNVRVYDDDARPADLSFQDEKHILFSFPFDLTAETPDAPDPSLSRVTLQVVAELPGALASWPVDGNEQLGISFNDVTAGDVNIVSLDGLPTIDIDNFLAAIHSKYDEIAHVYDDPASGGELILYDGDRDSSLVPPNQGNVAITAALETHGSDEYLRVTAPIHVSVPLPSGTTYSSYGRILFWRRVITTDTTITVEMGSEPADPALATTVTLDNEAGQRTAELAEINATLHTIYDGLQHTHTLGDNTLIIYDDARDPALVPANGPGSPEITAVFETHAAVEYLHVTIPIHVNIASVPYASYGRIKFWRAVTRTATTLSVNMAVEPADPARATVVELDAPGGNLVAPFITPMVTPVLASFGTLGGPSFGEVVAQLTTQARGAINNYGTITEPAFSEAAARALLQEEIAAYINVRRYPFYTPVSPDPDIPLATPVGFLLVADDVLAILLNRRTGTAADDHAPDNFLGSGELALAVGRARVDDFIGEAIVAQFPGLSKSNGSYTGSHNIETEEGDATLERLSVAPSDPGAHGVGAGHLWVSGEAEVHIDCWPDPDISFDGPIFIAATEIEVDGECGLDLEATAGDFDIDQSCCDVLIDLLIPVVGWIMLAIIENMIDEVGGELASDIAAGQAERIEPVPPVVQGIAEVRGCLTDLLISSQGFVFPGDIFIRRLGTSYEDLAGDGRLPRP